AQPLSDWLGPSRGPTEVESRRVLAVLSWARAFDSVSSASLVARRPLYSPVAHPGDAFRDWPLGRRVLPCALCRPTRGNSLFSLDAGNASHARLAVARAGDRYWIVADGRAFQFVYRPGIFRPHNYVRIEFTFRLVPPAPSVRARGHGFRAFDFEGWN